MLRKHFGSEFEILDESGTTTISSGTSFKIVSGGQTGVDRAALDWAMKHGLPHGGFCPKGRRAEDGVLHEKYQLQETESSRYLQRTKQNVLSSDGTLILNLGSLNDGSRTTLRIAESIGKPCLVQQLDDEITPSDIRRVLDWIRANGIVTLNIAGPRESKRPFIYGRTVAFLDLLFAGPQSVVAT
ncbi:MAG: putative molybdenum carrier protein [Rhodocyclaceae bacterium]|nr:putative molybdenum carrier protein [Rhodocyclaceae bacterium]MBL0077273.1 putative molybdenum carrier protein [Rhodocyclaceae bacterium]